MRFKISIILLIAIFPTLTFGNGNTCQNNTLNNLKLAIQQITPESLQPNKINDKEYVKNRLDILSKIEVLMREEQYTQCITPEFLKLVEEQNRIAVNELKKIMEKYLWITVPEFGFKASEDAWIIVQHAMHDPEFQHKVLYLMEYCLSKKEIDPIHYANLYDRITSHYKKFGMKLKYGTQVTYNDKKKELELLPYDGTLEDLNERRSKIGLMAR